MDSFVNSESWEVARTVYVSFTLAGEIAIDQNFNRAENRKHADAESILTASMNRFDVSKLEVYLGDQTDDSVAYNPIKGKESSDDDDDDEDDEDYEDDNDSVAKPSQGR